MRWTRGKRLRQSGYVIATLGLGLGLGLGFGLGLGLGLGFGRRCCDQAAVRHWTVTRWQRPWRAPPIDAQSGAAVASGEVKPADASGEVSPADVGLRW